MLVDQGSVIEIMYHDLYKGLNLKPEDLTAYESPLVSFEGKTVIPKGQIRLPIQTDSEVVEVDFIVVDSYSPYKAIVARPWLHALGAVSSTLHQKVRYPSEGLVKEIWAVNPLLDNAWWRPSCTNPRLSPRTLLKSHYSNQEFRLHRKEGQPRRRAVRIWKE